MTYIIHQKYLAVVGPSSLTEENKSELSRVQKTACKTTLRGRYQNYEKALEVLEIDKLRDRREFFCKTFAKILIIHGTLAFK